MDYEDIFKAANIISENRHSVLKWEAICKALGHTPKDVENWTHFFENKQHSQLFEKMLISWKKKSPSTATLEELIGIFKELGLFFVAENFIYGLTGPKTSNESGYQTDDKKPWYSEKREELDREDLLPQLRVISKEPSPTRERNQIEEKSSSWSTLFKRKYKKKSEVKLNTVKLLPQPYPSNFPEKNLRTSFTSLTLETEPEANKDFSAESLINMTILCSNKLPIRCSMLYDLYNSIYSQHLGPEDFFVGVNYMKCAIKLIFSEIPQTKFVGKESFNLRLDNLLRLNPSVQNKLIVQKKVEFPDKQIEFEKLVAKGICVLINHISYCLNRDNTNDLLHFVNMYNVIHPTAYQICRDSICKSLEINGFRYQLGELDCIKVLT